MPDRHDYDAPAWADELPGTADPTSADYPIPLDDWAPDDELATNGARRNGKTAGSHTSSHTTAGNPWAPTDGPVRDPNLPAVHPAAWHGLAGDIVTQVAPTTEADPIGVLTCLLAAIGACIGPRPHVLVGHREQPARIWPLLIGGTGHGRKGTAWATANRCLAWADDDFTRDRIVSGLTSGEGLITHIRDPEPDPKATEDPPPVDKRVLAVEEEFARVLAQSKREGNVLSAVLRVAWDTGDWQILRANNPVRARGGHLVVVGNITPGELHAKLADSDMAGGFANRFIPVLVARSKLIPDEPPFPDLTDLGWRLRRTIVDAKKTSRVGRTPEASELWQRLYHALNDTTDQEGPVAQLTARAAPYVQRIALLYALLDQARDIDVPHLAAAAALWRYVDASARRIYDTDPDLEKILAALRDKPEGITKRDLFELFSRHKTSSELDAMVERLTGAGAAEVVKVPTKGRPAEVLRSASRGGDEPDPLLRVLEEWS